MRHVLKRLIAAPALPFALCFATLAFAESNHAAWVRAALDSLPCFHEDRGDPNKDAQLDAIAAAVAEVSQDAPRPPREWAALLLTVGFHESTFSLRIHRGECKPYECDRGRARSGWQLHKNLYTAPVWDQLHGIEHTAIQVRAASDALRRAFFTCQRSGEPWLQGTLSAYAGRRCGVGSLGMEQRVATFNRLSRLGTPRKSAGKTSGFSPGRASRLGEPRALSSRSLGERAHAAQPLDRARLSQLFAQRGQLGFAGAAPLQIAEPFGQRHVAAQRRQASIQ